MHELGGYFKKLGAVLVAYSGGVDSSVLAKAAFDALGERALAVTFDTPTLPRAELEAAKKTAAAIGIRHLIVKRSELQDGRFKANPANRCYFCKANMAGWLRDVAAEHGIGKIVEGTNAQDLKGHRPGYKALQEAGVSSPLAELGLGKDDVRRLAKGYGLEHDKPSGACLASRIPTGIEISQELLSRVEESEDYLRSLGLTQVRVRVEGSDSDTARIEVYPGEFDRVLENRQRILDALPFRKVSLDLKGYS